MKKLKFTVIDAAIILLAVCMILTVVFRQKIVEVFDMDKLVTVEYEFEADCVKLICAEKISSVHNFYLASDLTEVGEIIEIDKDFGKDQDPNTARIFGKARVTASRYDDGYYVDGRYLLAVGCTYTVRDGYSEYEITVTDVAVVE